MKKIFFTASVSFFILASCTKEKEQVLSEYELTPVIQAGSVPGATVSGKFNVVTYTPYVVENATSNINRISGSINWSGLLLPADTIRLSSSVGDINTLNRTTTSTLWSSFSNGTSGSYSASGWPLTLEAALGFTANGGGMKIGTPGNYIYVRFTSTKIR
jgi:hypothetical protein